MMNVYLSVPEEAYLDELDRGFAETGVGYNGIRLEQASGTTTISRLGTDDKLNVRTVCSRGKGGGSKRRKPEHISLYELAEIASRECNSVAVDVMMRNYASSSILHFKGDSPQEATRRAQLNVNDKFSSNL